MQQWLLRNCLVNFDIFIFTNLLHLVIIKVGDVNMVTRVEADEMSFEDFVNNFHSRIKQTLGIKKRLMDKKYRLFKRAKNNPSTLYGNTFVDNLRIIVQRERMIHRLTEAALEKAGEHLSKVEVDARKQIKIGKARKITSQAFDDIRALLQYLKRRIRKMDKRLRREEQFLEIRDKKHLLAFLSEYKKELDDDLRLEREIYKVEMILSEDKVSIGRLENTAAHRLKRVGIKAVAAGAIPLTPVAIVPLKALEVLFRPITFFIADCIMALFTGQLDNSLKELEESSLAEKLKFEVETTLGIWKAMVEDLAAVVVEAEHPGPKRNHLFSGFKF